MRIIVDASVLVASLMENGTVRDVLLSSSDHQFFAPTYVRDEVVRNQGRIASRARLSIETVRALTEDAFEAIELLPPPTYAHLLSEATALAKAADALGDEEYIAMALLLEAPVWTLDKDFRRVKGIDCLNTQEVNDLPP